MPKPQTCQMENHIDSLHRASNIEGIRDIAAENLEILLPQMIGEVLKSAVGEIVHHANLATLFHQAIYKV